MSGLVNSTNAPSESDEALPGAADNGPSGVSPLAPYMLGLADDVMALIPPSLTTHEKRALGGIMRGAAVAGVIERTDRVVLCTRPNCHRAPITVWKSLMFRGSP